MEPIEYEIERAWRDSKSRLRQNAQDLQDNEGFAITILHGLGAASLVGALSQTKTLLCLTGTISFTFFLTTLVLALLAAILSADMRHETKKWHVAAGATDELGTFVDQYTNMTLSFVCMRMAMTTAVALLIFGFFLFLGATWSMLLFQPADVLVCINPSR